MIVQDLPDVIAISNAGEFKHQFQELQGDTV
jgi:hypothetical protein